MKNSLFLNRFTIKKKKKAPHLKIPTFIHINIIKIMRTSSTQLPPLAVVAVNVLEYRTIVIVLVRILY